MRTILGSGGRREVVWLLESCRRACRSRWSVSRCLEGDWMVGLVFNESRQLEQLGHLIQVSKRSTESRTCGNIQLRSMPTCYSRISRSDIQGRPPSKIQHKLRQFSSPLPTSHPPFNISTSPHPSSLLYFPPEPPAFPPPYPPPCPLPVALPLLEEELVFLSPAD